MKHWEGFQEAQIRVAAMNRQNLIDFINDLFGFKDIYQTFKVPLDYIDTDSIRLEALRQLEIEWRVVKKKSAYCAIALLLLSLFSFSVNAGDDQNRYYIHVTNIKLLEDGRLKLRGTNAIREMVAPHLELKWRRKGFFISDQRVPVNLCDYAWNCVPVDRTEIRLNDRLIFDGIRKDALHVNIFRAVTQ